MYYIAFMTLIGIMMWQFTGIFWFAPVMFVVSLIPPGIIIIAVLAGMAWVAMV